MNIARPLLIVSASLFAAALAQVIAEPLTRPIADAVDPATTTSTTTTSPTTSDTAPESMPASTDEGPTTVAIEQTREVASTQATDPTLELEGYRAARGISGKLSASGDSALGNLLSRWAVDYRRINGENALFDVRPASSTRALEQLTAGEVDLALTNRAITSEELDRFIEKHRYAPVELVVALDAVAIVVHKNNPIEGINAEQLRAIFAEQTDSDTASVTRWGQLGLADDFIDMPVIRCGWVEGVGAYELFTRSVLEQRPFRTDVRTFKFSSDLYQAIGVDRGAIGFASVMYRTPRTRFVPLQNVDDGLYYAPTLDNARQRLYPLTRPLYVYLNRDPERDPDPFITDALLYAMSRDGQSIVLSERAFPIGRERQQAQIALLTAPAVRTTQPATAPIAVDVDDAAGTTRPSDAATSDPSESEQR